MVMSGPGAAVVSAVELGDLELGGLLVVAPDHGQGERVEGGAQQPVDVGFPRMPLHIAGIAGRRAHHPKRMMARHRHRPYDGRRSPPWKELRMGILRGRRNAEAVRRFRMREKLASIGDDFWIEDEEGNRAFKVNGKALRMRNTFVLEDRSGQEVAKIQERKLSIRDKIAIERDGSTVATVHKALVGIRDRFAIDVEGGPDLKAHGNIVDHEYEIERDGESVARISKRWFRVRDTYGVEIDQGEDEAILLAVVVALEALTD
jgi:uncharacterized protein YxjI